MFYQRCWMLGAAYVTNRRRMIKPVVFGTGVAAGTAYDQSDGGWCGGAL
jgi:hypothetical protein